MTSHVQGLDETVDRYIEALRAKGYADLAIDYLNLRLKDPGVSAESKASIEFEIASSLISASESMEDLSKREQMLEDARAKFEEFAQKYPDHPRRAESLVQIATVDLQKGRLRIVQAQLPSNAGQAVALAKEARVLLAKSAQDYETAQAQFHDAYKAMPIYIPEDQPQERARKTELFEQYIESRFQAALARFYLADSYTSVEIPPADPNDKAATAAREKQVKEWESAYKDALGKARQSFYEIHDNHRRELVGLYGHLWLARCMAAQGEHRQAMGIYGLLMEHQNRDLEKLQREVFHFKMISLAARKEYAQIVGEANPWLRANNRYRLEPAYQGVQMELANAYIGLATAATNDKEKGQRYAEANEVLERLAAYSNQYTGIARREQLKISPYLLKNIDGRNFSQLFSLANAKLDLLKPELPDDEKKKLLAETKRLFRDAIAAAKPSDSIDAVNDARLALAYTHLQAEEIYDAAILCEYIARQFPKSTAAPQAAAFGVTAYAWGFDQALQLQDNNIRAYPETDAEHLRSLAEYIGERWPDSKEADEARATVGRLEMTRKNYQESAAAFDQINPKSPRYPESLSLGGGVYWDWYKSQSQAEDVDPEELTTLRKKAEERLAAASPLLHAASSAAIDRQLFLNDAMLGEVYYESQEDELALKILLALAERLKQGTVASEVEPALRIAALTTALQAYIRQNKLDEADGIINLIASQQGQEQAGNVTLVFVSLASRLREQMERVKSSGDAAQARRMADSFEKFLDRVAEREAGQTVQSLVYIADTFLELERFQKAVSMLQKGLNHPEASDPANQPNLIRARLLLARAQSRLGNFNEARATIDALLRENMNAKEVIMERGSILEAAGADDEAIKHWKWVINRMKGGRPRLPEFYEAVDRLVQLCLKTSGQERQKRIGEAQYLTNFLLKTDTQLPPEWRPVFKKHEMALKKGQR